MLEILATSQLSIKHDRQDWWSDYDWFCSSFFLPLSRILRLQYHFRGRLHVTVLVTAAKVMDHNMQRGMPFSYRQVLQLSHFCCHLLTSFPTEKSVCLVHKFNVGARLDRMHSFESACSITTHEPPVSSITSSA